jgi:single-stranded-DNA-specific exonuclease
MKSFLLPLSAESMRMRETTRAKYPIDRIGSVRYFELKSLSPRVEYFQGIFGLNPPVAKIWQICPAQEWKGRSPLKELGISPLTAQVLLNRGISAPDEARCFLQPALSDLPDPFSLKDMDKAVIRIADALRREEKITLLGDYDVDGTTATALLYLFLESAGGRVDFFIPHRVRDGYGINGEALKRIAASGSRLVITADCGVSNLEEIRWAKENGLEVIVTDHHEVPERLPPALAILNPKQEDCAYPCKELAGVGVVFNLAIALRSSLRREGFFQGGNGPNLKEYLDLVALGTVSDMVPLTGANRILAKFGLAELHREARPGIRALKEASGMEGRPVDTTAIHFRLAPRINAAGRLEDAREAVHLLITKDPAPARRIARHLNELNFLRQQIEEKMWTEAKTMIGGDATDRMKKSIVLASLDWHPGVIGIVASRLTEEYRCPAILIALQGNLGKGSGRSTGSFSLYEGLKTCQAWMETFGGHEQAAGLVIRAECISPFSQAFEEMAARELRERDFLPPLTLDAWTDFDQLNESFIPELEALAPFGTGNPELVLGLANLTVLGSRKVGKDHLRLRFRAGRWIREAIGFGMGSRHPLAGEKMKMAFSPRLNIFHGNRTLEMKIIDLQPMDSNS